MSFESARWISSDIPLPIFRRLILIDRPLKHAIANLCGLGQFELRANGTKSGDDVMEPAWSNYAKTCYFVTHDFTPLLRAGENAIEILLGNGMYNVPSSKRYKKFKGSFGPPKLIFELNLEFPDGTAQQIVSDESWHAASSPITFSCIYGGEDYDARRSPPAPLPVRRERLGEGSEQSTSAGDRSREPGNPYPASPGVPGEEEVAWRPVTIVEGPGGELRPQLSPPIRVMETFHLIRATNPRPGVRVFDLGQNFSGWPKLTARGRAGATIKLIPAELLDAEGLVSQKNSGSPVYFTYTLNGAGGDETWHPRFSYTGFRYLQAEGDLDALVSLEGQFVYSSAKQVGHFECSNDLFNRIHKLILNAIKSNLQHVLTDCPHREKLGWLEQTHLMGPAIFFNFDVASLYRKICADMRDAQLENGCVPTIAPQYTEFQPPWDVFNDSPEWGSAMVLNPWLIYQFTGDRAILEENYDAMKRYVDYLTSRAQDGIIDYGLGDWYDIGPGDPGFSKLTSKAVTATAFYVIDLLKIFSIPSRIKSPDFHRFGLLSHRVRKSFGERFFDPATKRFDTGSQTAQAVALTTSLPLGRHRKGVLDLLVKDIRAHDNHLTAGDIGFGFVLKALAENGRSDVIFDLLSRTDPPSYGAQLAAGATTLTEAWDANPKVSQNHLMLGHAEIWFYHYLAGIELNLGYARQPLRIAPAVVGDITYAAASYESSRGLVVSRWERSGGRVKLNVTIPPHVVAKVEIPGTSLRVENVPTGEHEFDATLETL